jgi:outer membrane protein OmpA-like peptidoglycan-associated protein
MRCLVSLLVLAPAGLGAQNVRLPAVAPGLQLTWASSLRGEPDYETVITITGVDSAETRYRIAWNRGLEHKWRAMDRRVSNRVRRTARALTLDVRLTDPPDDRGSPQSVVSGAVLRDLKGTGRSDLVLLIPSHSPQPFRGAIQRVGSGTESFPVLLDGRRATVPGIRGRGDLRGDGPLDFEVLLLDDPDSPWVLEAISKVSGGRRQLVRIGTTARERDVAQALETNCTATVHDIYFASGSDVLDSTSTPSLDVIARTLTRHADWRVTIVGHTDSIGAAPANLELSRRRAERVRTTLVSQYDIAAGRLRAEGKGETQPLDDNGTLPGRSRNRRVDLVRACGPGTPN